MIAFHFPPEPVAGSLRPGYLAANLHEYDWDVTVLTRPFDAEPASTPGGAQVITAPVLGHSLERSVRGALGGGNCVANKSGAGAFRSALGWAKRTLLFPDFLVGWTPHAVSRGCAAARVRPFDAMLSTAMPATVHVVASMIAKRLQVPWIADYRDLWSLSPGHPMSPLRAALQLKAERALLRRSAAITAISQPIAVQLQQIHGRRVAVIPNASDPHDWQGLEAVRPRRFQLCYTGTMYEEWRSPTLLFQALASLRAQGDAAADARVVFFGPPNDYVVQEAQRCSVADLVAIAGVVPRAQALLAQREASNLLMFLNMDPSSASELGSKIIEYTRSRRPILAFGPRESAVREHIAKHSLGWFASDLEEARRAIREAHRRFVSGEIELPASPAPSWEARDLARAFAKQLDEVMK